MALTETFLELAPEFGGTRFGPFSAMEIRLGSDPNSNDIVLPENLGVLPNHMKLIAQGDGSFIVAPIERTAGVFVYRPGSSAKQVTSPIAIQSASDTYSADSVSLVTPEGPRFFVLTVMQKPKEQEKGSAFSKARSRLSGKSLWAEVKRQGITQFLTTRGGQMFQRYGTMVKSGTIFRPRYIIMGATILIGWAFAGGLGILSCNTAVLAKKADNEVKSCKDSKALCCGESSNGENLSVEQYAAKVLGQNDERATEWYQAMRNDAKFMEAFQQELTSLMENPERQRRLEWVYKRQGTEFALLRQEMKNAGWPEPMIRVFPYVAAIEGAGFNEREWTFLESDSLGGESCGRGPMAMTWRQAYNLKFDNFAMDAPLSYGKVGVTGAEDMANILTDSAATQRTFEPPEDWGKIIYTQTSNAQGMVCLHNDEEEGNTADPRSRQNRKELVKALGKALGPGASKLPALDSDFGMEARLLMYFAADYKGDFKNLDLSSGGGLPTALLDSAKPVKAYAMQKAAETLAKAVFIPCMARKDANRKDYKLEKTIGDVPKGQTCGVLTIPIEYGAD